MARGLLLVGRLLGHLRSRVGGVEALGALVGLGLGQRGLLAAERAVEEELGRRREQRDPEERELAATLVQPVNVTVPSVETVAEPLPTVTLEGIIARARRPSSVFISASV